MPVSLKQLAALTAAVAVDGTPVLRRGTTCRRGASACPRTNRRGLRAYLKETAQLDTGEVTDRLGRRGEAYGCRQSGSRPMLIMDPATGAVLGTESTFTKDQPEYGVKAGDVMDYSAWTR